jgi:uncharacterized protein YcnI
VRRVAVVVAAAMLVPAAGAAAHVAIKPPRAAAGSEARLTLEVPNERPAAATRKIDLQMPAGVTAVRARALRGWKLRVREAGGEVRRVTLTAGAGRALTGDQRGRFGLRMTLPATPGRTLVFKVLQTYDNGEVVRWIGPPGTSEPAGRLRLGALAPKEATAPGEAEPDATPAPAPAEPDPGGGDGGDGDDGGVPIWAGIGLILLAAVAGSSLARRRNRRRVEQRYPDEGDS